MTEPRRLAFWLAPLTGVLLGLRLMTVVLCLGMLEIVALAERRRAMREKAGDAA